MKYIDRLKKNFDDQWIPYEVETDAILDMGRFFIVILDSDIRRSAATGSTLVDLHFKNPDHKIVFSVEGYDDVEAEIDQIPEAKASVNAFGINLPKSAIIMIDDFNVLAMLLLCMDRAIRSEKNIIILPGAIR
jgi:hypothetical protein